MSIAVFLVLFLAVLRLFDEIGLGLIVEMRAVGWRIAAEAGFAGRMFLEKSKAMPEKPHNNAAFGLLVSAAGLGNPKKSHKIKAHPSR